MRLTGWDIYSGTRWPTPPETVIWTPLDVYSQLYSWHKRTTMTATGLYDSFLIETASDRADLVLDWLLWTMEQPWPELRGLRIPAEGARGYNWRKFNAGKNPEGLVKDGRAPFSTECPLGVHQRHGDDGLLVL